MDWAKKTTRREEKHLSLGFGVPCIREVINLLNLSQLLFMLGVSAIMCSIPLWSGKITQRQHCVNWDFGTGWFLAKKPVIPYLITEFRQCSADPELTMSSHEFSSTPVSGSVSRCWFTRSSGYIDKDIKLWFCMYHFCAHDQLWHVGNSALIWSLVCV